MKVTEGDQTITSRIIRGLYSRPASKDPLAESFSKLEREEYGLFSHIIRLLSDIDMNEKEAEFHYKKIIQHAEDLETKIGRRVGFRVAMLDYLLNINPKLNYPKIMELSRYDSILKLSTVDGLTGLYNRRYFDEQLDKEIHRSLRNGHTFSIVMIDIDNFKKVNDSYGHPLGDEVLKGLSYIIKNHLRSEDVGARYGGEEFIILLPHTDIHGAIIFSERLLESVRAHDFPRELKITFSGGIANYPYHTEELGRLVDIADKGLYLSKMRGKDRISVQEAERRDARRYRIGAGFSLSTDEVNYHRGRINDISVSGLAGKAKAELSPGQIVRIRLEDREQQALYDVHAQVVWVNEVASREDQNVFGVSYSKYEPSQVYHLIRQYTDDQHDEPADHQLPLIQV
jgi:diguanylate cyclase (GGDEF)-like protein